jgi:hypothetical protein
MFTIFVVDTRAHDGSVEVAWLPDFPSEKMAEKHVKTLHRLVYPDNQFACIVLKGTHHGPLRSKHDPVLWKWDGIEA